MLMLFSLKTTFFFF